MGREDALLAGIRAGIVGWYDFVPGSRVLCLGAHRDLIAAYLQESGLRTECAESAEVLEACRQERSGRYDYIVSIGDLEQTEAPGKMLDVWREMLASEGRLLLGLNNRLGLKYFCGDRDPYTERNFDGIENYRRAYAKKADKFVGRMYARAEIAKMLRDSGWDNYRFFSVLTDLENPAFVFAEDFLPNEDMANRLFPTYHSPDTVFLEEEGIHASLIENGMFHKMANAFFVECSPSGDFSDVLHATCSMERGREDAFFTIIRRSEVVEKRAAYPEGRARLERLAENIAALKSHGVGVVEGKLEGDVYRMPYIHAEVGQLYLKNLLFTDKEKFLVEMDRFRDTILRSSELVEPDKGDGEGAMLERGYWDMVPLNSFFIDGEFVFFDQEFCLAPCPANFVIYRMLGSFYAGNPEFEQIIPMQDMLRRYGLDVKLEKWQQMDRKYLSELRKEQELEDYHKKKRRNGETVNTNRHRMNYSYAEYQRLFVDIFHNADSRKLLIWGSGKFAEKFMAIYRDDYPVYKIVDNQPARWGQKLNGVEIVSPDFLKELGQNEYKVLICIKNYAAVMEQLEEMGVTEYSIYDVTREYQRKFKPIIDSSADVDAKPKKYRVGYIAGVFDLFHVGHLNMFKRAKEQCHYLIVGVVSDEGVRKFKKVEPFVPCDERIEMIRSCRFVDQVVKLPLYYADTWDVWKMYHFDVQFSGSDYEHNDDWLKKQAFLREQGADLVFFPYTESTSSTRLKRLIEKKLL